MLDLDCVEHDLPTKRAIAVGSPGLIGGKIRMLSRSWTRTAKTAPTSFRRLADMARQDPGEAFVAQRTRRSEGVLFRLFYRVYVLLFRLLTGNRINFGNSTVLPISQLHRLTNDQSIWNHFAPAIVRSRVPVS
jgi:hypothetical protein